jgi:hypothetical protein
MAEDAIAKARAIALKLSGKFFLSIVFFPGNSSL